MSITQSPKAVHGTSNKLADKIALALENTGTPSVKEISIF
jgi:hypothetical protein